MSFQWQVEPGLAIPQLVERYTNTIFATGRRVADQRAEQMENWAKVNAPWTDRTGAARRGLFTEVLESPGVIAQIIFSHGEDVPYAVWLEIAHASRFSVIGPAIDHWGPIFMRDIQRIVNLGLATRG